jgi:hypothetical protein
VQASAASWQTAAPTSLPSVLRRVSGGAKFWVDIVHTAAGYFWNGVLAPNLNCGSLGCGLWGPGLPSGTATQYYLDTGAGHVGEGNPGTVFTSLCMSHVDADGDGAVAFDCNDADASVHPGATEVCIWLSLVSCESLVLQ